MKKSEIVQRLEAIEKHIGIAKEKSKLEVGKWYKGTVDFESLIFITEIENVDSYNRIHGYGFISGEWNYLSHLFSNTEHEESLFEATPQEVEEALVKESIKRGIVKNNIITFMDADFKVLIESDPKFEFDTEYNTISVYCAHKYLHNSSKYDDTNYFEIFDNGLWYFKLVSTDKFAELKKAYKNGSAIQSSYNGQEWVDLDDHEYRIKPEEKPKVGDVVKAWDDNENYFVIGRYYGFYQHFDNIPHRIRLGVNSYRDFKNSKTLTKQEAIDLLFK